MGRKDMVKHLVEGDTPIPIFSVESVNIFNIKYFQYQIFYNAIHPTLVTMWDLMNAKPTIL